MLVVQHERHAHDDAKFSDLSLFDFDLLLSDPRGPDVLDGLAGKHADQNYDSVPSGTCLSAAEGRVAGGYKGPEIAGPEGQWTG